jgi:dethiobiotin synthetase
MSRPATWFVTGTDTDAGKTCVARALLSAARVSGLKAMGYKPIESGCSPTQEFGADAVGLAEAAGTAPQCSYVFAAPVAPLHAAKQEGLCITMAPIAIFSSSKERADFWYLWHQTPPWPIWRWS